MLTIKDHLQTHAECAFDPLSEIIFLPFMWSHIATCIRATDYAPAARFRSRVRFPASYRAPLDLSSAVSRFSCKLCPRTCEQWKPRNSKTISSSLYRYSRIGHLHFENCNFISILVKSQSRFARVRTIIFFFAEKKWT